MRKWTMSACVVLAWCILTILAAAGPARPARAQATHRIAISTTPVTLTTFRTAAMAGDRQPAPASPAQSPGHAVRPGDSLSRIAAALGVRGGWPAGVAIGAALIAGPAMVIGRRRRREARRRRVTRKANLVLADHDRLIVMYSQQDDTVYVLTPPGEDPRAVLRAARLVVPEERYGQLADHLGVPASWPLE